MHKKSFLSLRFMLIWCVIFGMAFSGCSPAMRKKFIRQKKKTDEEDAVIPVLDPIDYPNSLETVKKRYDYFYALLKVWRKDALTLLDDEPTDKRMVYILGQIRLQLEELQKILTGKSAQHVREGLGQVDHILAYYDKPEAFRNKDMMRTDIQRLTDIVIKPLEFDEVKNDLKQ